MKKSRHIMLFVGMLMLSTSALANLSGDWEIRQNGKPSATVRITQKGNTYQGVIVSETAKKPTGVVGKTIITGLTADGKGGYTGGKITDPTNGKKYDLSANVSGNTLKLRGYLGVKALGQTQTWYRK